MLDGNELGDTILEALLVGQKVPADLKKDLQKTWRKIGNAIVSYIKEKAEVDARFERTAWDRVVTIANKIVDNDPSNPVAEDDLKEYKLPTYLQ